MKQIPTCLPNDRVQKGYRTLTRPHNSGGYSHVYWDSQLPCSSSFLSSFNGFSRDVSGELPSRFSSFQLQSSNPSHSSHLVTKDVKQTAAPTLSPVRLSLVRLTKEQIELWRPLYYTCSWESRSSSIPNEPLHS